MTTARASLEAVADGAPDALERARELAEADIEARGGGLALQSFLATRLRSRVPSSSRGSFSSEAGPSRQSTKARRVSPTRNAVEARDEHRAVQEERASR